MVPQRIQRRLAAILAADVVGYSRLMGEDETGTLAQLKSHRTDLIDPKIAEHGGRIVKLMGDGALVEFASVVDAVHCAVEIQRGMPGRNAATLQGRRIEFRIGINLGDVIVEGDDIYGDGVNVAARLEGLAETGGICISGSAFDQVRNKLDVGFAYLGAQRVKNIAEPVRAYRVLIEPEHAGKIVTVERPKPRWRWAAAAAVAFALVVAGGALWLRPWSPDVAPASPERLAFPLPEKPSIAVLPFGNLSGDPGQDVIADGFTESLVTTLAQMPELFVIDRNSTLAYKDAPVQAKRVAEELGVRYVLAGSLQRDGATLRVAAQLIDAFEGHHLWAGRFDRSVDAVFAVQDEIIREIFTALQVELVAGEHGRAWQKGASSFEAYLVWLQGWKHFRRNTKDDNAKARQLIRQAIEMDPDWAMPHTTLAWTHVRDATRSGWSDSRAESLKLAAESAERALALDDSYPGVFAALGGVHEAKGEIQEAIEYHRKAVALGPNISVYHAILAYNLTEAGHPDEAIPMLKKAMRLSPSYQPWYLNALGDAYNAVGEHQLAVEAYRQFLDRQPDSIRGRAGLVVSLMWLGRGNDARTAARELIEMKPDFSLAAYEKELFYKDPAYIVRLLDALRAAGLPE